MTIETLIWPGLALLSVTLIARLIERRSDVLYGPHIQGSKTALGKRRDRYDAATSATGLRRDDGRLAVKLASVSTLASAQVG
jgi:hypothetical protein